MTYVSLEIDLRANYVTFVLSCNYLRIGPVTSLRRQVVLHEKQMEGYIGKAV